MSRPQTGLLLGGKNMGGLALAGNLYSRFLARLDHRLNLLRDVEVCAPRLRLEPELFAIGFHGRRSGALILPN